MNEDESTIMLVTIILIAYFVCLVMCLIFSSGNIILDQEVADDVCKQLTGDETAVAEEFRDGENKPRNKLQCVLPTYDSTQNIIVKQNGE